MTAAPRRALALVLLAAPTLAGDLTFEERDGSIAISIDGELFTAYHYGAEHQKPFLWPLVARNGARVTRDFPMVEGTPGEASDHPHHTSVWFAHGEAAGLDLWHGGHGERVVDAGDALRSVESEGGWVVVRTTNVWRSGDGEEYGRERLTMRFGETELGRVIDFEIAASTAGEWGDTKEGTFGVRLAPSLRLEGPVAQGNARNSAGVSGKDVWGKRARWIDYWGPVGEETAGVALLEHPSNFRHPTWWHARAYGLVAANPFGRFDFERIPGQGGELKLPEEFPLVLRYRLLVHDGEHDAAALERAYAELAAWSGEGERVAPNPLVDRGPVELVLAAFEFTEGPAWRPDHGDLLFSDIPANTIYRYDPASGELGAFRSPSRNSNGLLWRDGKLYAAEHSGRRVSVSEGDAEPVSVVERFGDARLNSPNDMALAADGTLYFTDPPYGLGETPSEIGACNVYRLQPGGELELLVPGDFEARPNGIALSPDERWLYVGYSRAGDVRAYDLAGDAPLAPRPFAKAAGGVDGMVVDAAGNLYVTSRAGVEVFAPDGHRWGWIDFPAKPANCTLGGPDGKTLFVTARNGLYSVRLPNAGAAARETDRLGLPLALELDFEDAAALDAFAFTDARAWTVADGALELLGGSEYAPPHRSPLNIALLDDVELGSFALEATLTQTGREYGHRDLCLFFGFESPSKFYYVHLATTPDDHANNVFVVNDAARVRTAPVPAKGVEWGTDQPHRVRLERDVERGTIRVFFDDMETPVLETIDHTHGRGRVGFGSFDDQGRFDDVRIFAHELHPAGGTAFGG